jgi:polygalacturonase
MTPPSSLLPRTLALLVLASGLGQAVAANPQLPAIPNRTFPLPASGSAGLSTAAIQSAIDRAKAAGGGRVLIPAGTFVSGPIQLKSNVDLHLARGAVLRMSPNFEDFPANGKSRENFISANKEHDVQISGEGIIDGQGQPWWVEFRKTKSTPEGGIRRPQMIVFTSCQRVRLAGISTLNPPNCHVAIADCTDVTLENLTLRAPGDSPNTDGLNLRARNVVIRNCDIATGDDNIVLLASHPGRDGEPAVQNIAISNCKLGVGHGLSIGSYTAGGIRHVSAESISFVSTTCGIRMKASRDRGGLVEDLAYRNITMKGVATPIALASYYPKEPRTPEEDPGSPVTSATPKWRHICIENLTATESKNSVTIWGVPEAPFAEVRLRNVRVSAEKGARIFNAKPVKFEAVQIEAADGVPLTTYNAEVQGMKAVPFKPSSPRKP